MTKIIHLSDLHVGKPGRADRLQRIVAHLLIQPPTTIVITGDVTQDGSQGQYDRALEILRPLTEAGFLLLVVPGNHDVGFWGLRYQHEARQRFDAFLADLTGPELCQEDYPYAYDIDDDVRVICVDSCVPPVPLARGNVGYGQRSKLAAACELAQEHGRRIVVALHHHPWEHDSTLVLADWEQVLSVLSARCDVLLFGHKHVAGEWSDVWRVARAYAADATTDSMRYRVVEIGKERVVARWVKVE